MSKKEDAYVAAVSDAGETRVPAPAWTTAPDSLSRTPVATAYQRSTASPSTPHRFSVI